MRTALLKSLQSLWCGILPATACLPTQAEPESVYYVNQANPSPVFSYTSWGTAATNIQDAIDAAALGGLASEGTMTNRVVLTRPLTLRSVNGPAVTVIEGAAAPGGGNGDGAVRCAHVANGAVLSGFTLTNGHTRVEGDWTQVKVAEAAGGGVWAELDGVNFR
jgi:hypothetical protein